MRIIISGEYCDDSFVEWLVREIRQELIFSCDDDKLEQIGEYVKESLQVDADIYDIFLEILNSIEVRRGNKLSQIIISNRTLYGDKRITTPAMAKLIDIGNMDIRGLHLFSSTFDRIRNNLEKYFTKYLFKNGGI